RIDADPLLKKAAAHVADCDSKTFLAEPVLLPGDKPHTTAPHKQGENGATSRIATPASRLPDPLAHLSAANLWVIEKHRLENPKARVEDSVPVVIDVVEQAKLAEAKARGEEFLAQLRSSGPIDMCVDDPAPELANVVPPPGVEDIERESVDGDEKQEDNNADGLEAEPDDAFFKRVRDWEVVKVASMRNRERPRQA
ncbi:unnamed protein product, partial [Amoebophrya sp. A25]